MRVVSGLLPLLAAAPLAVLGGGHTETLECGDALSLASRGPFTPGQWVRVPSRVHAREMLKDDQKRDGHDAKGAQAAESAAERRVDAIIAKGETRGATRAELLAREALRFDVVANGTYPGSRTRFQVVCYGKDEGETVNYGDTVALRVLHRDQFLTDGHGGDLKDLYHSLDSGERDRNFATLARGIPRGGDGSGHFAPPERGAEFQFFDPSRPNARGAVTNNVTVVLRSTNLQTLTVEKPVLGLPYRQRVELRVLTADDLVLNHRGEHIDREASSKGLVDWSDDARAKASRGRTEYPAEALFLPRVLCATSNGRLCNGKGVCRKGRCDCAIEYDGPACEFKRQFATCHVTGDPHVQTFDGRRYNVFSQGEYLAYYNPDATPLPERKSTESVTVTMKKLPSGVTSSTNSVTVRSRKVAVKVTTNGQVTVDCGKSIAKKVRRKGGHGLAIPGSDLRVRWLRNSRRWRISSGASGLVVWVESFGWGVNVWVRTFQVPRGVSTGLCGNYNGAMEDDLGPPDYKLRDHVQPSEHLMEELTIPAEASIAECRGANLDFGSAATDMVSALTSGDPIAVGDYKFGKPQTEEEKELLKQQSITLLADADRVCGNESRRKEAHRKCECRGFDKVEEFHLFADCVLDICETLDDEFVAADCAAEQGDADEVTRIKDYQLELDRMEIEMEHHMAENH